MDQSQSGLRTSILTRGMKSELVSVAATTLLARWHGMRQGHVELDGIVKDENLVPIAILIVSKRR